MICYKLTIAYEGTNYSGWQFQSNASSIQALIENALSIILKKEKVAIVGSGRTDAGVHAKAQIAHFYHEDKIDLSRVLMALNGILPKDIRILQIEMAPANFHARFSARGKEYHYYIHLGKVMDPFRRLHYCHIHRDFDVSLLKEAAKQFIGTHDFTSFANEAHKGASAKNPVRTLYRLDVIEEQKGLRLEFEGNGFLYKMVRNIVGLLIDIATHCKPIESIQKIFALKDRQQSSKAAPAQGLFLVHVKYSDEGNE